MANAHTTNESSDVHTLHETLHETEKAMQNAITNATGLPISAEAPAYIDTAARHLGLKPVRAWVPDNPAKPRSSSAERTRRSREKAKQQGIEPLSVLLPVDLHEPVKALAVRVREGELAAEVWADLLKHMKVLTVRAQPGEIAAKISSDLSPAQPQASSPPGQPNPTSPSAAQAKPRGWRCWLLRWLLPPELRALID